MRLNSSMNCSVLMRRRTLSWATMSTPSPPRFSLPPVWSPCQCVLSTNRIGLGAEGGDRGLDLGRERRELVVDQEDAVVADRDADVAARALQHVEAVGQLGRLDLDLAPVAVLGRRGQGQQGEGPGEREGSADHEHLQAAHPNPSAAALGPAPRLDILGHAQSAAGEAAQGLRQAAGAAAAGHATCASATPRCWPSSTPASASAAAASTAWRSARCPTA